MKDPDGFVPPPYPYDRLDRLAPLAAALEGGVVDLSIGTPCDPPLPAVVEALSHSNAERGYPASIGTEPLRKAIQTWLHRQFGVDVPLSQLAACVGTKEFVATTPQFLKLRRPSRDTVLYPAVAYPTYEMGATLAGCRGVPVPAAADGGVQRRGVVGDAVAHRAEALRPHRVGEQLAEGAQGGGAGGQHTGLADRDARRQVRHGLGGEHAARQHQAAAHAQRLRPAGALGGAAQDLPGRQRNLVLHAGEKLATADAPQHAALACGQHVGIGRGDRRVELVDGRHGSAPQQDRIAVLVTNKRPTPKPADPSHPNLGDAIQRYAGGETINNGCLGPSLRSGVCFPCGQVYGGGA